VATNQNTQNKAKETQKVKLLRDMILFEHQFASLMAPCMVHYAVRGLLFASRHIRISISVRNLPLNDSSSFIRVRAIVHPRQSWPSALLPS
jgi:hypothetical protein